MAPLLRCLAGLLMALFAGAALAQAPVLPSPTPAPPAITPAQAQQALDVLRDDKRRAEFTSILETIVHGTTPAAAALPILPDSLGAELLERGSDALASAGQQAAAAINSVNDLPLLWRWIAAQAGNPVARARLLDTVWKLAVVLACAGGAEWVASRLFRPLRATLERWAPDAAPEEDEVRRADGVRVDQRQRLTRALRMLRRLPYVLARLAIDLLPLLGFAAVGTLLLGTALGAPAITRSVILAVIDGYILCRAILCVMRMLVSPDQPRLRLLHVSEWGARFLMTWTRRLTILVVASYTLTEVALLFGLYRAAHDSLLKLFALVGHLLLVVAVLQARAPIRRRIHAPPGATGAVAGLRNRLSDVWHIIAIFYIIALWLVWAIELRDGYARLLHFFVITSGIILAARLVAILLLGGLDRAARIGPALADRHPWLQRRADLYYPLLRQALRFVLLVLTAIALLQGWGLGPLGWFSQGELGPRVVSAIATICISIVLAVLVWEGVNGGIERHLAHLTRDAQIARSARLRTLLPMLRTTLLVTILLVVGLMVLSEIGVNIAPLLAGAGVIGIAVGFGSQKLVQDLITGLFLLLENAMQVGDVVTLGGLSGTVEALSIRTIRLRALDGSVHLIPFSAVTTVTNLTRDYSFAVLDISVGLNEEPDHVIPFVRELAASMRDEAKWSAVLLEDLEVMGVEKFTDVAWVLRVRAKTLPASRWAVARELNRRVKEQFDALAIESPITAHRVLSSPMPPPPSPPAAPATPAEQIA